jgi:hypothetical protein
MLVFKQLLTFLKHALPLSQHCATTLGQLNYTIPEVVSPISSNIFFRISSARIEPTTGCQRYKHFSHLPSTLLQNKQVVVLVKFLKACTINIIWSSCHHNLEPNLSITLLEASIEMYKSHSQSSFTTIIICSLIFVSRADSLGTVQY